MGPSGVDILWWRRLADQQWQPGCRLAERDPVRVGCVGFAGEDLASDHHHVHERWTPCQDGTAVGMGLLVARCRRCPDLGVRVLRENGVEGGSIGTGRAVIESRHSGTYPRVEHTSSPISWRACGGCPCHRQKVLAKHSSNSPPRIATKPQNSSSQPPHGTARG